MAVIGGPVVPEGLGAADGGVDGVVIGEDGGVQRRGGGLVAHPYRPQGEGGALEEAEHPAHPRLLVPAGQGEAPQEGQADEAGGGAPVPGEALGAAAGEALLLAVSEGGLFVIQIPEPGVVEKVGPVPGVAGAVGHDADGVPVDAEAAGVGLHHHGLPGPVGERPVEGRHRPQEGDVRQTDLLLQTADGLLHRGAPAQQVKEEEGGLDGAFAIAGAAGVGGEAAVVELSAHESPLVEPLVEHRPLGQEQAGAGAGVPQGLLPSAGHRDIGGAPGENGDLGPLRQPVKVVVPAPEVFAVPSVPAQGAASRPKDSALHVRASSPFPPVCAGWRKLYGARRLNRPEGRPGCRRRWCRASPWASPFR